MTSCVTQHRVVLYSYTRGGATGWHGGGGLRRSLPPPPVGDFLNFVGDGRKMQITVGLEAAMSISDNQPAAIMQCRQYYIQVGHGRKCGGSSCWDPVVISSHSKVISASVLTAAILDFLQKDTSDCFDDVTFFKARIPENGESRHRIHVFSRS